MPYCTALARNPVPGHEAGRRLRNFFQRVPALFWSILLLLCGIGIAYHAAVLEHRAEDERQRATVRAELEPIRAALSRELFSAFQLTEGVAGLIAIEGRIADDKLRAFVAELLSRNVLIRNVALAPDNVVGFVFPRPGNEGAIGLDYARNPAQWPSVARMMRERHIVVAGPVKLVQGGIGIVGRKPIYLTGSLPAQSENRYWGLVSTVVDFERLLAQTNIGSASGRLDIALRGADGLGAQGAVFWGLPAVFDRSPAIVEVPLPSGQWQLAATPRGGWAPLRAYASPYFLGGGLLAAVLAAFLHGLLRTSAARQRAAVALTEREQHLSRVYDAVDDAVFLLAMEPDGRYRFVSVNAAFTRVTGFSPGAAQGKAVADIVPAASLPRLLEKCRNAIEFRRLVRWEEIVDYPAGRLFGEIAIAPVFDQGGQCIQLVGSIHDVTERNRAWEEINVLNAHLQRHAAELEQRVSERTSELAQAKERAESADRLKSAFLATMSHELRTPLNSIIGFTGIVMQEMAGPLNDEQKKQLGMVYGSAQHLLALINDVLDISKIEAGELRVIDAPFDLRASIGKVTSLIRPLADKKGLALEVHIADRIGEMPGDARRVEQILLNLLSNAIKFTEQGTVALQATRIDLDVASGGSSPGPAVQVSVRDTGIGIKAEDLELLFAPFRQVDSTLTRAYEGTGLGLAISQRLAALMGGRIEVTSRWREGSEFVLTLPLRKP